MYHTENDTTVEYGNAVATVIADSVSPAGKRITTLELVYPRFIHAEFLTHRAVSRNAASSRATPTAVLLKEVGENAVYPSIWRKNQPGMRGGEELSKSAQESAAYAWKNAARNARLAAERLANLGVAKETVNRLLEPFARIRTLVTATEWDNFFKLRLDKEHVQPEMYELAFAMKQAMAISTPIERRYHLPYVGNGGASELCGNFPLLMSAARCARVSYLTHDQKRPDELKDYQLAIRLKESEHMSPFEHPAFALSADSSCANFRGWQSYRYRLEHPKSVEEKQEESK